MEQQPSTSTVAAQPTPSVPSATALSTPRSSSAAGVESSVERVAKQVSFKTFLELTSFKSGFKQAEYWLNGMTSLLLWFGRTLVKYLFGEKAANATPRN